MGTDKIACSPIKIVLFCVYLLDYGSFRKAPATDSLQFVNQLDTARRFISYEVTRALSPLWVLQYQISLQRSFLYDFSRY